MMNDPPLHSVWWHMSTRCNDTRYEFIGRDKDNRVRIRVHNNPQGAPPHEVTWGVDWAWGNMIPVVELIPRY